MTFTDRSYRMIRRIFLLLLLGCVFLQDAPAQSRRRNRVDSLKRLQNRRDSLLDSFKNTDTSLNSLLQRVEFYSEQYNNLGKTLDRGFDTIIISRALPNIEQRIREIKQRLVVNKKTVTLRYLYTERDLIVRLNDVLDDWQNQLEKFSDAMVGTQQNLDLFKTDSSLRQLPVDSALRAQFIPQIRGIRNKWRALDERNRTSLQKIGMLQNRISQSMIAIADYRQQIDANLRDFGTRTLTQEFPTLFFDKRSDYPSSFHGAILQTLRLDGQQMRYFARYNLPTHLFVLAVFIVMLWWIAGNRRVITSEGNEGAHILDQVSFLRRSAVMPALVVACTVGLFVYDHPPIPLSYCFMTILVVAIAGIIPFVWSKRFVRFWLGITTLFFFFALSNLLMDVSRNERYMLFFVSVIASVSGFLFLRDSARRPQIYLPRARPVFILYTALQTAAVVLNFFGRFSLAKIFGLTGIFMLWQAILLYLFVQILLEALFLELEKGKNKSRFASYIDFKALQDRSRSLLNVAAIILWFILQAQNFNIADVLYDRLGTWLGTERTLGGNTFSFGGILIFCMTIWLSVVISRMVGYFFEYTDRHSTSTHGRGKYRSSMLLIRIAIFTLGFMFAVTASGFPWEKITLVIGALGVGIGLGLQDLVKNVVSGIVLAFEKPLQVGDVIEVEKRKGVVKEIGIRASKIAMYEGAEVVVPNGMLLSQNLTNWTLSSKARRVELPVGVAYGADLERVMAILNESLQGKENMMYDSAPFVVMSGFGQSSVDFKVFFWVADPAFESSVRADVMVDIYRRLSAEGISIPFPQQDVYVRFPDGPPKMEGEKGPEIKPE